MAHDMGHPLAFHLDAINEVENYDQVSREGVWWLPRDSVQDSLILSNQGKYTLDLTLTLFDASGKSSRQKIALGPRQTGRYSVREILKQSGLSGTYGGVKIESAAHAGSLDTVHVLFDEEGGFSANLKMFDRDPKSPVSERDFARTGTWTLRAPMLALTNPDPAMAFPGGTILQPQLFVRNTSEHKVNATLQFNWRTETTTGKTFGPALQLQPYETRRIDVAKLLDGTIPKDAHWSAVILKTNGLPDEVMAVAASYDKTLRYGAQTPFSDQMTFRWEGGKWEVDRDHDSIVTAGNGGTKPIKAAFTIYYNRGAEKYQLEQTLQPDDQMWIDIGDLIHDQVPDKDGKTLPADLSSGSYQFSDLTNKGIGSLFEGKVIYDLRFGHVSYGCASCCAYLPPVWFAPDPLGVPLAFQNQADVEAHDGCDSADGSVIDSFYSWSSANTSIATINTRSALVTGVAVGSAAQSSPGDIEIGALDFKQCRIGHYVPSGTANVGQPAGMLFFSDFTTKSNVCVVASQNGTERQLQYQIVDVSNRPVGNVPMQENFANLSTNTCKNRQPAPANCAAWDGVSGVFTDYLSTNACSPPVPGTCGFSINPDLWQYCKAGSLAQTLGKPTYGVLWQAIYVDGSTAQIVPLTPVPK